MADNKAQQLESFANCCGSCVNCVMHETRNVVVFGSGNCDADVVLVGEAPGREEDLCGKPFIGDAGRRLENELLPLAGLSRSEVYITNACKCRPIDPHGGNRKPTSRERAVCKPLLLKELEIISPEVVVLLGATPLKTFFGYRARVQDCRGRVLYCDSLRLFSTYHPSSCARQWGDVLVSDFKKLKTLLQ